MARDSNAIGRRLRPNGPQRRRVLMMLGGAIVTGQAQTPRGLEARRQSLLVSGRPSEAGALVFIADSADLRGWA